MSIEDFERCTPAEFRAVYWRWQECEEKKERARWERTRMECLCILQPWSEGRLEPGDVMKFAWDAEREAEGAEADEADDTMERYKATIKRLGLNGQDGKV